MAQRHPYDRDRWDHGREREDSSDYRAGAHAREDRGRWFGENEEIARQRGEEEYARARAAAAPRERWGTSSAWGNPRTYSSDREYGDRGYGRWNSEARGRGDEPGWSEPARADRTRDYGWRRDAPMPSYGRVGHGHYAEPGYLGGDEYDRQGYGGPYGRERYGAREWSSTEGWRVPGPHAGRGPRGYQRSDERIHDELHERLTAHGLIDATDVECRVVNGEVTLTGFVDSRAAKRAAEDLAEDIYGVRQVHNELRIRSHADDGGVGRTSVLGLTESQIQRPQSSGTAVETERPRTRT
jgi:hypothetical protein